LQVSSCQIKTTHTHPPEVELKLQIQVMMKMRMNFVMGNVCDKLERVDKRGNEDGTSTQDVRKEGCEPRDHVVTQPKLKDTKFLESQVNQV